MGKNIKKISTREEIEGYHSKLKMPNIFGERRTKKGKGTLGL